jgi:outer membrane protein
MGRAASAADEVGLVNSRKILFQHPQFDETTRILLFLSRTMEPDQLTIINAEKDQESKRLFSKYIDLIKDFIALDGAIAAEKDPEKKKRLTEDRQARLNQEEGKLMAPILTACQGAVESVVSEKKMTLVLENEFAYFGGTDITEDVIQKLKADVN